MKNIVIIGSGWATASFLKYLNLDENKYNIIIISPSKKFIYTPLLVSSIFNNIDISYDILNINNKNNKQKYIEDKVKNINFDENYVVLSDSNIEYDYLVLAHGAEINTFNIQGVKENCMFIKDEDDVIKLRNKLVKLKKMSNIAVIGCGLTGTELIGNLLDTYNYNIIAIDGLNGPLTMFNNNVISLYIIDLWRKNNIYLYFNYFVQKIDDKKIYLKDKSINYDLAIWCGGIKANSLSLKINEQLKQDSKIGIPVNEYLEVINTKNVFAIGDCGYNKLPPSAQVAYQEGKYLANNFNNNFKNKSNFIFNNKGQICYIGKGKSVYNYKKTYFHGNLTGYLNNYIHLYNAINFEQRYTFLKDIFNKN